MLESGRSLLGIRKELKESMLVYRVDAETSVLQRCLKGQKQSNEGKVKNMATIGKASS